MPLVPLEMRAIVLREKRRRRLGVSRRPRMIALLRPADPGGEGPQHPKVLLAMVWV